MPDNLGQGPSSKTEDFTLKQFYETIPPGRSQRVSDLVEWKGQSFMLTGPDIMLHCDTVSICEGIRRYKCTSDVRAQRGAIREYFVSYVCWNCSRSVKTFAVRFKADEGESSGGEIYKYGEFPNFGPPTPPRLTRLLGSDKELFLKGRRAENQGMGIAAFAYYRRVIESQKDAIFDEIIRVSKGISADPAIIAGLEKAKKQVQFTNAVEEVKDGVPSALLINGHNPLTLMHSALSEGLHARTDEECLTWATDLRVVMAEFVERMAQAMKDNVELHSAVSRLISRNQLKPKTPAKKADPTDQETNDIGSPASA